MLDGMLKYGKANYRAKGIRLMVYVDALKRHVDAIVEGEDIDRDSGLPHLAHVLATVAIVVDAMMSGKLTDDRPLSHDGAYRKLIDELTPHVARLQAKHATKNPKHYLISDREVPPPAPKKPEEYVPTATCSCPYRYFRGYSKNGRCLHCKGIV